MSLLDEIREVEREAIPLYSNAEVESAITRIAGEISAELGDRNPLVLTVLNGGIIFAGKLLTQLPFPLEMDAIHASRYRGQTQGRQIQWIHKPTLSLKGRVVLLVDDILDEGQTLAEIIAFCKAEGAQSIYAAVLVDKILDREKPCHADFVGLQTGNFYLFGYGMDYKNYLRNAPGIFACKNL